jgi:Transposase
MSRAHPRNPRRGRGINRRRARCVERAHAGFGGRLHGKGPSLGKPGKGPRHAADPYYYLLEGAGLTVQLVNPAHARQLAGRPKTDLDAQQIARLAEMGLLRPSFVPPPGIRALRDLTRTRV